MTVIARPISLTLPTEVVRWTLNALESGTKDWLNLANDAFNAWVLYVLVYVNLHAH